MKRIIACIVALMVCAALALPVAASTFTPSVTYKDAPEIVPVPDGGTDSEGNPAWGIVWKDDIDFDYIYEGCLIITSVAEASTSTEIPEDAKNLLLDVYDKLNSGDMKLPYDKLGLDAEDMVIRDLFDASFLCGDGNFTVNHPEMLKNGALLEITFDIGAGASDKIYAMTYADGAWNPVVKTVNNGDGTVTCLFSQVCPVVFCVDTSDDGGSGGNGGGTDKPSDPDDDDNSKTGDVDMTLWIVLGSVSLVAVVALAVVYRVKFSKKS